MGYEIEVTFETGNSFGSETCTERVGATWSNLEEAKESLNRIKAHYKAWELADSYNSKVLPTGKEPWYYKGDYEEFWEGSLVVPCEGGSVIIGAFWTGYFERLYSARIVSETDESMEFSL